MTVAELISRLREFPQDAMLVTDILEGGGMEEITTAVECDLLLDFHHHHMCGKHESLAEMNALEPGRAEEVSPGLYSVKHYSRSTLDEDDVVNVTQHKLAKGVVLTNGDYPYY